MSKLKYVVFDNMGNLDSVMLTAPEYLDHKTLVNMVKSQYPNVEVVSAGFLHYGVSEKGNALPVCYGKSIGLNLDSRPERDTRIAFYNMYGTFDIDAY